MKILTLPALLLTLLSSTSFAALTCEQKFDRLEELRVASFDLITRAPTKVECLNSANQFLEKVDSAPKSCKDMKTVQKAWADSFESDTHKTLSNNADTAFEQITEWSHATLVKRCDRKKI